MEPAQNPTDSPTRKHLPGLGSIYLRGRTWHIEYWRNGQQFRETSKSAKERQAIALLKQRAGELARDEFINPQNDKILAGTLLDALKQDYANRGNRSSDTLGFRLSPLREAFGHLRAVTVSTAAVESYKARRVATGKARATVNRELAALRRAYRLAVERKQVSPGRVPRIELFAEDNVRQGFVDYEDFQGLLTHLAPPLDDLTRFAYHSGWRKNEILTLCWTDINRGHTQATLRPEFSKNRETRQLPLIGTLAEVIERRWQARLISSNGDSLRVCDLVFHRAGEPIRDFRGAWEAACTAIGKPNLLFHDLRRSAVRNLIQGGTPERVAMKITGHKTRAIFDRYHIVDSRDMEAALERTESRPAQIDHFPAQTACGRYRKRSS